MFKVHSFPSRIVLELTPLCNLSCAMCPRHYIEETGGYMTEQLFIKLVDEIKQENSGAILLPFWRGESCLHPRFDCLLYYALDKQFRIHLSTNGHYVAKKYLDIFYRCEFLTFSIHTSMGFKNAKYVIDNKPKWCQTTFQISFVDSEKTTQKFLSSSINDSNLLGFDCVRLYREHTLGGEFGKMRNQLNDNRKFCPKLVHTFVVSSDGYFSRCNHIWETQKEYNLEKYSIKEIWQSEVMQSIREQYPDAMCAPCNQWSGHTCGEFWKKEKAGILHKVL